MVPHIKKRLAAALNHCQGTRGVRECKYITRNIICTCLQVASLFSRSNRESNYLYAVKQRSVVCANAGVFLICDYLRGAEKSLSVWKYGNRTVKQKPDRLCPHCSECQSVPFLETSFSPWCHIIEACGQPNAPLVTISALLVGTKNPLVNWSAPLLQPEAKWTMTSPFTLQLPTFLKFYLRHHVAHFSLTKLFKASQCLLGPVSACFMHTKSSVQFKQHTFMFIPLRHLPQGHFYNLVTSRPRYTLMTWLRWSGFQHL